MRRGIVGTIVMSIALVSIDSRAADVAGDIEKAHPYIDSALNRPMDDLYSAAQKHNAFDMMIMGLALFAGRTTDGDFSETDVQALAQLDARIEAPLAEYLRRNPRADFIHVDWRKKLKLTEAELDVVGRYQSAYLPDFWLGFAITRTSTTRTAMTQFARGTASTVSGGSGGMSGTYIPGSTFQRVEISIKNVVERPVFNIAVQCVRAVREAAGLKVTPLGQHPTSVRIFRSFLEVDTDQFVEAEMAPGSTYKGPVGAAACGTQAQFDAYVADLKASVGS